MKLEYSSHETESRSVVARLAAAHLLHGPLTHKAWVEHVRSREPRPLPPALRERWAQWLERRSAPDSVRRAFARSARWMVVTGQQAGALLGPALTVYKAVSAIRHAQELEEELGEPVLPVFWVADDDHDLGEVNHATVLDAARQIRRFKIELSEKRAALSTLRIPTSAEGFASRVFDAAGIALDEGAREAFEPRVGELWTDWFLRCLFAVFGKHGLVPIVPRLLTPEAMPLFRRALEDPSGYRDTLDAGAAAVEAAGLDPPLRGDQDPPVFTIDEKARQRVRIAADGGGFIAGERPLELNRLAELSTTKTPRLSANASLRVLIQNAVLPVAAYVAGPAEARYWGELSLLHKRWSIEFPWVWPRLHGSVLGIAEQRHLRKLAKPLEQLLDRSEPDRGTVDSPTLKEGRELAEKVEQWLENAAADRSVGGTSHRRRSDQLGRAFRSLLEAMERTAREGSESALQRRRALLATLLPRGAPQERVVSALPWALSSRFLQTLLNVPSYRLERGLFILIDKDGERASGPQLPLF